MSIEKNIWPVILKHLENKLSDEDSAILRRWLNESPDNENKLKSIELIWNATGSRFQDSFIDEQVLENDWVQIRETIQQKNAASDEKKEKQKRAETLRKLKNRRKIKTNIMKAAALLLVAFASVYLTLQYASNSGLADNETIFRVISTHAGERANVDLGDGTRVVLNAESKIEIPDYFTNDNRLVKVSGQAFFDVKTDESNPFFIESGDAVIRVIGTAFDVRSYEEEADIRVAVREGIVELTSITEPENALRITENQLGSLSRDSGLLNIEDVPDMDLYTGWLDGRLIFKNTPLSHVFNQLKRWYGIEIVLDLNNYALLEKEFSADLKMRSVENVFEVIAQSMDIQYSMNEDNDRIVIRN